MTTTTKTAATNVIAHDEATLNGIETTAGKVRYLATVYVDTEGKVNRGTIAKILGIRYQWVRNVLITPLKK